MLLFFYLRVLFAKKTTAETGQPIATSSNTTLYRRPVTIDEPLHVFNYRKLVFSKYDDLSEPRPQVQVLAMYFTHRKINCDDLKFDTNSKCPLCIPPQSQNRCCDIHNVVGTQFHRHYNTMIQIQWSYRPSHITTQYSSGNSVFGPCLHPTGKWRLTETSLVLVLFFIPFILVFLPIVWPS
jgi:hypothetical protein